MYEFLQCAFCVFAGLLVGYAIFYRDRSEDNRLHSKLKSENADLRRSTQTAQAAFDSLDAKYSRQRGQLNVLQQLCDDWSSSREINERERAQLESDLETKNSRVSGLEQQYLQEKEKRIGLEDQVHALTKEKLTVTASIEDHWRSETAKIESSLTQKVNDIAKLASDNQRLTEKLQDMSEKLHDMAANVAKLESELDSEKSLLATASNNASGLKQEYISLETALRSNNDRLKEIEANLAREVSSRETAQQSLVDSDKRCAVLETECETLKQKLSEREIVEQQVESLRTTLTETEKQLARVSEQRDQSMEAQKAAAIVASGLQKRLDNQESTIHLLRQNQDDALENLKHELQTRSEIETKFDSRVKSLRDDANSVRAQYESQIEALRKETEALREQHESQLGVLRKETETLRAQHESQLDVLRKETESAHDRHKQQVTSQSEKHQQQLVEFSEMQDSRIASLSASHEAQLAAIREELQQERLKGTQAATLFDTRLTEAKTGLVAKISELESNTNTYSQSIVKLEAQREQLANELEIARRQMQSQLKKDSETIGELQRQREDLKGELEEVHTRLASIQTDLDAHTIEANALGTAHDRISDLEQQLGLRSEELSRLQAQSAELSRLRQQYHESSTRQESLQQQLDDMIARQIKREAEKTDYETTIRELQAKLEVTEETVSELRKERAFVLARIADQQQTRTPDSHIISFTQAVAAPEVEVDTDDDSYDDEYGGRTRRDANRGVVYTERPETSDDLKRISGIAEVLEKRLNDFGVYTFRQVMQWQPEEIEEFSRLLAFRDRIVRDDWQGQARFLYNQKRKTMQSVA